MNKVKTMTIKLERILETSPTAAFNGWLNPKIPGTPWNEADKLVFQPKVDGLFYWYISGTPHYGHFREMKKGSRIQHTWMSPYTLGLESVVTITFKKQGSNTLMTLEHKGLPDNEDGRGHNDGWSYFLDNVTKYFNKKTKKK